MGCSSGGVVLCLKQCPFNFCVWALVLLRGWMLWGWVAGSEQRPEPSKAAARHCRTPTAVCGQTCCCPVLTPGMQVTTGTVQRHDERCSLLQVWGCRRCICSSGFFRSWLLRAAGAMTRRCSAGCSSLLESFAGLDFRAGMNPAPRDPF